MRQPRLRLVAAVAALGMLAASLVTVGVRASAEEDVSEHEPARTVIATKEFSCAPGWNPRPVPRGFVRVDYAKVTSRTPPGVTPIVAVYARVKMSAMAKFALLSKQSAKVTVAEPSLDRIAEAAREVPIKQDGKPHRVIDGPYQRSDHHGFHFKFEFAIDHLPGFDAKALDAFRTCEVTILPPEAEVGASGAPLPTTTKISCRNGNFLGLVAVTAGQWKIVDGRVHGKIMRIQYAIVPRVKNQTRPHIIFKDYAPLREFSADRMFEGGLQDLPSFRPYYREDMSGGQFWIRFHFDHPSDLIPLDPQCAVVVPPPVTDPLKANVERIDRLVS